MSRRIARALQAELDNTRAELEHITRDRARLIAMSFWEEESCSKTQQNAS